LTPSECARKHKAPNAKLFSSFFAGSKKLELFVLSPKTSFPGVSTRSDRPIVHRAGTPLAGVTGTSASRRDIDICHDASARDLAGGFFLFHHSCRPLLLIVNEALLQLTSVFYRVVLCCQPRQRLILSIHHFNHSTLVRTMEFSCACGRVFESRRYLGCHKR
jgi:hypothetical protein